MDADKLKKSGEKQDEPALSRRSFFGRFAVGAVLSMAMPGAVYAANALRKVHGARLEAFAAGDAGPLAWLQAHPQHWQDLGLLMAAFLSATVFPFQSEVVLFGMLAAEHYQVWLLVAAASLGNVLGSCVNWLLGRFIALFEGRRWFPITKEQVTKAEGWYQRWGKWSLLLSWAPIIGDPLTIVAGILRKPFPVFLALVTLAKVGRYIAVA